MNLFERLGIEEPKKPSDLSRILNLPRRPRPEPVELAKLASELKARLGIDGPCECVARFKRACCKDLRDVQAWVLSEAASTGGILGPIGVGHGKTLLDLLTALVVPCQNAVLLLPSGLKAQLLEQDWAFYGQHWKLPNLAGGRWHTPGRPTLHVIAFSELSGAKATELLHKLKPELIIVDEAHNVKSRQAARTKRFLRFFKDHPNTRLFCWSGTLTSRSLHDYAHLSQLALGDGAPTPHYWPLVEEWSTALDENDEESDLRRFAHVGGSIRDGFRRRLLETRGVVSSGDSADCQSSLILRSFPLTVPTSVKDHLKRVTLEWVRPDGEELIDGLTVARVLRQLSLGFYYRWRWPRGESLEVRSKWLEARKEWHKELREKLKHGGPHMDSPLLLTKAAIRWFEGYTHIERDADGNEVKRRELPPHTKTGPLPTWKSDSWLQWRELRDTAQPATEPVWLSDFALEGVQRWLASNRGIIWYEFGAFESALREIVDLKGRVYGAGEEASRALLSENGEHSIAASSVAHGVGKNLQQFNRGLVCAPPSDGARFEQLLGRMHRPGQLADEVVFDLYQHTATLRDSVDTARNFARYIEDTMGNKQKACAVAQWLL